MKLWEFIHDMKPLFIHIKSRNFVRIRRKKMAQNIYIRLAKVQDANAISYLVKKSIENTNKDAYTQQQIENWKKSYRIATVKKRMDTHTYFCAFIGKKLVGVVGIREDELVGMYVSIFKRKRGVGIVLLNHLEKFAMNKGLKQLVLNSTINAKEFYLKHGFRLKKNVSSARYGIADPNLDMIKYL